MLKLDQYSESVLFQCDRCRYVGELFTDIVEEEGAFYCWRCLNEINGGAKKNQKEREEYAAS